MNYLDDLPDDATLSRKVRRKILIALSVSFFAAFTVIYVSGVIAKKVTHSEYDETIQKFQAWMKAQDDKPIQP